jgi:uncharacterized membrane protein (DUF373 family)
MDTPRQDTPETSPPASPPVAAQAAAPDPESASTASPAQPLGPAAPPAPSLGGGNGGGNGGAHDERLVRQLQWVIRMAVRALAVLMTLVIMLGVVDVAYVLYNKIMDPPRFILTISDILATFGAFMAVLIAIEIFLNIVLYLRDDVIHVKIVMATALMAIARKVIILDIETVQPGYIWGIAAVVLAMSVGYALVHKFTPTSDKPGHGH